LALSLFNNGPRAQTKIYLYPKNSDTTQGYYLQYTAAIPNGKTIVVLPGGGYNHVAVNHEGKDVAQWLVTLGYDVFVLHYRVSNNEINYYHPAQLQDVTKTVNHIRKQYKKIGIMGFSAGGHLAGIYLTSKNNKVKFGIISISCNYKRQQFLAQRKLQGIIGE
jgi:acetyl esterase/lipase